MNQLTFVILSTKMSGLSMVPLMVQDHFWFPDFVVEMLNLLTFCLLNIILVNLVVGKHKTTLAFCFYFVSVCTATTLSKTSTVQRSSKFLMNSLLDITSLLSLQVDKITSQQRKAIEDRKQKLDTLFCTEMGIRRMALVS